MGCSASKWEDEEAVQVCKDRRNFIKQAVEQRTRFATAHLAYIQSLKRVSAALHNFVEGDEHHDFLSDPYITPPFTPAKRLTPQIIGIPLKSAPPAKTQSEKSAVHVMKYMRSGTNPSVSVEEWPRSPENVRVYSYYPMERYGDGFFSMQNPQMNSSFFPSPYNRPSYPPPSPQASQWDSFWNPFSSLDTYGYPSQMTSDDEMARLRRVREEEGIPELEEEDGGGGEAKEEEEEEDEEEEDDDDDDNDCCDDEYIEVDMKGKRPNSSSGPEVAVPSEDASKTNIRKDTSHDTKGVQTSIGVSEAGKAVELEVKKSEEEVVANVETPKETPGFTVYVNRRHTSMGEVMKEIESQFMRICDCAHEISMMLEAGKAQYSSASSELKAIQMLNPVALFHSASLRSSSSRFMLASSSSREDAYESSSDHSEESCMLSGSHQSTLDRLYVWEKKLYEEVKSGERIRVAYEKKCMQLRNQDVVGEEPSSIYKTRAAIRDLHTRLKVSIHTVESISKRIETLRDEELHPQLMELIQGLARMWRTMADCHRIQKRTMDEAKLLLASFFAAGSKPKPPDFSDISHPKPRTPTRSALELESELRKWRSALEAWVGAQRSYARALAGWAHRCGGPPNLAICGRWARAMEAVGEDRVVDGLDFFAAGIASVCSVTGGTNLEEDWTAEKTAEMAGRVVVAGLSVAVGSLLEFAAESAEGYQELLVARREDERVEG